jgi:2-polyprenyl-3-methyl-5-hydroxy-6-metoxy-1,4-benzoquinol methylase
MNHLAFYRAHNISPVRYSGTREQHFQRRASLYRSLRLPPLAFRGARVLEVAAGTGQNAEYLASLVPSCLHLIEPHAEHWKAEMLAPSHTTFEEFAAPHDYEIAICENFLGLPEVEAGLLDKLAALVAPDGVLVLTCIHPLGIYPNLLRRKIAARLVSDSMSFEEKTALLVRAFETHLATLKNMTRSPTDWVQDMLLNPAVEHIGLTFPMLIERLGAQFTILGTSPEFITDWRWFKELHGEQRQFNQRALGAYNFSPRFMWQNSTDEYSFDARQEAEELLKRDSFTADDIRDMQGFKSLFGRETLYLSMQRNAG